MQRLLRQEVAAKPRHLAPPEMVNGSSFTGLPENQL
jgi:hypothetical protein